MDIERIGGKVIKTGLAILGCAIAVTILLFIAGQIFGFKL